VWFQQLKEQRESAVPFGDLEDVRRYVVPLIRPGLDNSLAESVATSRTPMPARLFVVGGKIVAFVIEKSKPEERVEEKELPEK